MSRPHALYTHRRVCIYNMSACLSVPVDLDEGLVVKTLSSGKDTV